MSALRTNNIALIVAALLAGVGILLLIGSPAPWSDYSGSETETTTPTPRPYTPSLLAREILDRQLNRGPSGSNGFQQSDSGVPAGEETPEPCRTPCAEATVTCSDLVVKLRCGTGCKACASTSRCMMTVSEAACAAAGITPDDGSLWDSPPISVNVLLDQPRDEAQTAEELFDACVIAHEARHLADDTCENSDCQLEVNAFGDTIVCFDRVAEKLCAADPDSVECDDAKFLACAYTGAAEASTCQTQQEGCGCSGCQEKCDTAYAECMAAAGLEDTNGIGRTHCHNHQCAYCDPAPASCYSEPEQCEEPGQAECDQDPPIEPTPGPDPCEAEFGQETCDDLAQS